MYNMNYIETFNEEYYMSILKDYSFLTSLIINHQKRLHDKTYKSHEDIILESLTHYVLYKLKNDKGFKHTKEYQSFIDSLIALISNDYIESTTNIFILNCNLVTDIKPFISSYDYQHLLESQRLTKTQIDRITNKINKNHKISEHDLDVICDYHSRLRDTTSYEYEILIRYLFNNKSITITNIQLRTILDYLPSVYHLDNQLYCYDLKSARIVLNDTLKTNNKYIISITNNINISNIVYILYKELTNKIDTNIDSNTKALLENNIFKDTYLTVN